LEGLAVGISLRFKLLGVLVYLVFDGFEFDYGLLLDRATVSLGAHGGSLLSILRRRRVYIT
jgi:hypothetical protein